MTTDTLLKTSTDYLTPADFEACSVWIYDQDREIYLPVRSLDDLFGEINDLQICGTFTTPLGHQIQGKVVGTNDFYAIGLFVKDEIIGINRHMREDSRKQVAKFLELSGLSSELNFETLFPLRFRSSWGGADFNDFEGVFEKPE
jgi:hypothetical protein